MPMVNTVDTSPASARPKPYSRLTSGRMRGNSWRSIALMTYAPRSTAMPSNPRLLEVRVSARPRTCVSLSAISRPLGIGSRIPIRDPFAGPEEDIAARMDVLQRFAEVAHTVRRTHDIGVHDERHDARRTCRIFIDLFELVDRARAIFCGRMMLDQHHRHVIAFLRIRNTENGFAP